MEEERRLAYVAITRAKQKLYILTAMNRRVYGQMQNNIPSRFINEIPTDCLHIINSANRQYYGGYQNYGSYNKSRTQNNYNRYSYETDDSYSAKSHTLKGVRVYHQMFGYGTIVAVEGEKCEVVFDKSGRKKIYASYLVRI